MKNILTANANFYLDNLVFDYIGQVIKKSLKYDENSER